jgi:hypothetical protein
MNEDVARIKKHHGGPPGDAGLAHQPAWKRMHRSPFFWLAAVCIMVAMVIFVVTDGFALRAAPAPATHAP